MKITRQQLIDLARHEVLQRTHQRGILSGYLIGSVVGGDPLLGDTADIDLVLIHRESVTPKREAVRLSHQVHLDISHHSKDVYMKPSELRVDPWLGPSLCEPIFLHDPEHFFEWAQAGARGGPVRGGQAMGAAEGDAQEPAPVAVAAQPVSENPGDGRPLGFSFYGKIIAHCWRRVNPGPGNPHLNQNENGHLGSLPRLVPILLFSRGKERTRSWGENGKK